MNHSFIHSAWNEKSCAKCARPESDHNITTCESCGNTGNCELIGSILMCLDCQAREASLTITSVNPPLAVNPDIEQLVDKVNKLAESSTIKNIIENAIKGNIKQYTDFFNAKMPSIIELKRIIDEDNSFELNDKQFALAKALSARIKYLSKVLFEFRSGEIELSAEVKSIQQYMNSLIPQLRKELREQFAESNINYKPIQKEVKIPKIKVSAEDRLAEGYAKLMRISLSEAKTFMANKLRSNCTCQETPGFCKVHK